MTTPLDHFLSSSPGNVSKGDQPAKVIDMEQLQKCISDLSEIIRRQELPQTQRAKLNQILADLISGDNTDVNRLREIVYDFQNFVKYRSFPLKTFEELSAIIDDLRSLVSPHALIDPKPWASSPRDPRPNITHQQPQSRQPSHSYNFSPPTQAQLSPSDQAQLTNGMAVAGFVLALVAICGFIVPGLNVACWILGLVFSSIGLGRADRFGLPYRGLAVAGLVISIVGFVMAIVGFVIFFGVLVASS